MHATDLHSVIAIFFLVTIRILCHEMYFSEVIKLTEIYSYKFTIEATTSYFLKPFCFTSVFCYKLFLMAHPIQNNSVYYNMS